MNAKDASNAVPAQVMVTAHTAKADSKGER